MTNATNDISDADRAKEGNETQTKRFKSHWFLLSVLLIAGFVFLYYQYGTSRNAHVNIDYYRILSESSTHLNQNVAKLTSLLENYESRSVIRSHMPSFSGSLPEKPVSEAKYPYDHFYQLDGNTLTVFGCKKGCATTSEISNRFEAKVRIRDLLPVNNDSISQYLIADRQGHVLASAGIEKTIQVMDLNNISLEIIRKKYQVQSIFTGKDANQPGFDNIPLPSQSTHIDMELAYGKFRIFIYPFTTHFPIKKSVDDDTATSTLYLVGLVQSKHLSEKGSGYWNISILVVSVISLLFLWAMIRLFLLPKNQSITPWFKTLTLGAAYGFFTIFLAFVSSYIQHHHLLRNKDVEASHYAHFLSANLEYDLFTSLKTLHTYQPFFIKIASVFDGNERVCTAQNHSQKECDNGDPDASTTLRINQQLQEALSLLPNTPIVPRYPDFHRQSDLSYSDYLFPIKQVFGFRGNDNANKQACYSALSRHARVNIGCEDEIFPAGRVPRFAITPNRQYQVSTENVSLTGSDIHELIEVYKDDSSNGLSLNFLAGNLTFVSPTDTKPDDFNTAIPADMNAFLPGNLLSVFYISEGGISSLPSLNFQEVNSPPKSFDLNHRFYFKKVRNNNGWTLGLNTCAPPPTPLDMKDAVKCGRTRTFKNVYAERLLNLGDGTRGTTLSMPMTGTSGTALRGILAADILLPSISPGRVPEQDMLYMVIDRNSGDVLFHSDELRSKVENLYSSGNDRATFVRWIAASLDHVAHDHAQAFDGHYHGQQGRFVVRPTPVDEWAMVVFYPYDSLSVIHTNHFLFNAACIAFLLALIAVFVRVLRFFSLSAKVKHFFHVKQRLNGLVVLYDASFIIAFIVLAYGVGILYDLPAFDPLAMNKGLIFCGLLLATGIIAEFLTRRHWVDDWKGTYFSDGRLQRNVIGKDLILILILLMLIWLAIGFYEGEALYPSDPSGWGLILSFLAATLALMFRLRIYSQPSLYSNTRGQVASLRVKFMLIAGILGLFYLFRHIPYVVTYSFAFHYQQIHCSWVNQEQAEYQTIASNRFPNSFTRNQMSIEQLLPPIERNPASAPMCKQHSGNVRPDDFPSLDSQLGFRQLWRIITQKDTISFQNLHGTGQLNQPPEPLALLLYFVFAAIGLILWREFHQRIVWKRIYYSESFIRHIDQVSDMSRKYMGKRNDGRCTIRLSSEAEEEHLIPLSSALSERADSSQIPPARQLTEAQYKWVQETLMSKCPTLQKIRDKSLLMPNLRIWLKAADDTIDDARIIAVQRFRDESQTMPSLQVLPKAAHSRNDARQLVVVLSEIDTCLQCFETRKALLSLIIELKTLALSSESAGIELCVRPGSLLRVKVKNQLTDEFDENDDDIDYLSWSECLLDFQLHIPDDWCDYFDVDTIRDEVTYFPELQRMCRQYCDDGRTAPATTKQSRVYQKEASTWNAISLLAQIGGPLYRLKWLACNDAEKLALYHLTKGELINPINTHVTENLAMKGLVRCDKNTGKIVLVNRSFAHFISQVENVNTLEKLDKRAEQGTWKNYRVPVALVIIIAIGGIALTSGESIYIIAASMAGILGTIASVASSASALRGQGGR